MLEPCEAKVSRTVLRGLGGSNPARLLDRGWGLVWRETGAVRNARASRGQAAYARKRRSGEKDSVAFRLRMTDGC